MTLTLHTLKPAKGSRTKSFRVGRGAGSGRGKTAGRGTKGQRSRTGGRKRLKLKGMKQMLLGFPKLRGFTSRYQKAVTIPLARLATMFEDGATVDLKALRAKRALNRINQMVKIVGSGAFAKKIKLVGIKTSVGAKAAIEKAGGSVTKQELRSKNKELRPAHS